jgi:hypothetical protein
MDCLYCSYLDLDETAVGVCRCGAGLCRQHVTEQLPSREQTSTIGIVTRTVTYGPTERRLLCPACAATTSTRTMRTVGVVD